MEGDEGEDMLGKEGEIEKGKQGRKVRLGGKGEVVGEGRSWGLKRKHEE